MLTPPPKCCIRVALGINHTSCCFDTSTSRYLAHRLGFRRVLLERSKHKRHPLRSREPVASSTQTRSTSRSARLFSWQRLIHDRVQLHARGFGVDAAVRQKFGADPHSHGLVMHGAVNGFPNLI